ncbi:MAG: adenosylcobinamide-phosphate synthase CbiB [Gammaproteobacteria bacterium]|nr:MAG: adenosylcobinamide-phosphate synthase CbiB [Gammaproteobacteria bacterium]
MAEFLLATLIAVALDQFVPHRWGLDPFVWYKDWVATIEQRFNGGERYQGWGALALALIPVALAVLLIRFILSQIGWPVRFVFDVVVLYFCLDLYRLNLRAIELTTALEEGRLIEANERLRALGGKGAPRETEAAIATASVQTVFELANVATIAPLCWFLLLGPVGAVVQRMTGILGQSWGYRNDRFMEFGQPTRRFSTLLSWVPARITAISFAMVGNFEDALHNWRRQSELWLDNSGPLRAAGFGAMNLRYAEYNENADDEGMTDTPEASHVRRALALVWRVVLLWLMLLVLAAAGDLLTLFSGW